MSNNVYESIMVGLNEALNDAEGKNPLLKRDKVTIESAEEFTSSKEVEDVTNSFYKKI